MSDNNVVDLEVWKKQRDTVKDLERAFTNGQDDNTNKLVMQMNKLMTLTSQVMDALINDFAKMQMLIDETQRKGAAVAQQSYLALQILEQKGVATEDEMRAIHEDMMKEQLEAAEAHQKAMQEALQTAQEENEPDGPVSEEDSGQPLS